ncbi:MAG: DUF58 domain-containing protein, partial [Planctomycetia bacterium]|nr:DUF58 domain-containing protein [Planctomycetia bacterium]
MAAKKAGRLIDVSALSRLSGLQFKARSAVEGYYSGIHKSPYHGASVEFAEYREYSPGDELKRIDWRVFGKTDRYFVKLTEAETNLNCYLLLDASGSMEFGPTGLSRLDYGSMLCAAIALLFLRQGDNVGLVTFDNKVRNFIPPRGSPRHFMAISDKLE